MTKQATAESSTTAIQKLAEPRADAQRCTADDWSEEVCRQASDLAREERSRPAQAGLFAEFRRKLAMGEALSRAAAKLVEALRFSGRITITFHQGKVTKTVLEELYISGRPVTRAAP